MLIFILSFSFSLMSRASYDSKNMVGCAEAVGLKYEKVYFEYQGVEQQWLFLKDVSKNGSNSGSILFNPETKKTLRLSESTPEIFITKKKNIEVLTAFRIAGVKSPLILYRSSDQTPEQTNDFYSIKPITKVPGLHYSSIFSLPVNSTTEAFILRKEKVIADLGMSSEIPEAIDVSKEMATSTFTAFQHAAINRLKQISVAFISLQPIDQKSATYARQKSIQKIQTLTEHLQDLKRNKSFYSRTQFIQETKTTQQEIELQKTKLRQIDENRGEKRLPEFSFDGDLYRMAHRSSFADQPGESVRQYAKRLVENCGWLASSESSSDPIVKFIDDLRFSLKVINEKEARSNPVPSAPTSSVPAPAAVNQ